MMVEENNPMEEEFVCGDPKVDIRIGDEYQADIPPMISDSKRAAFLFNPLASDLGSCSLVVGLPLEVTWIDTKSKDKGVGDDDDNVDMSESLKSLKDKRKQRMNLEAVPEKPSTSWEDVEVDGFVLGLYTFGKNFTQVKKLLESKETGEILSFYYGKFYKSAKHKIWSKKQSSRRKCIQGKKLYSGWRLQHLLSRLISNMTINEESQRNKLVNVSKSFAEGNTSLERYISAVKELVGLRSLVEAVAIGKDNDLTELKTEPVKSKQWFKLPSAGLGAYTSLTTEEIIEKLDGGGGSRLSKARCKDIFWEAVWPRLLARGWHSEKSKDKILFLIPGVEKFSRRKLVEQNHYFDSISDILKKVVAEPELLEFETAEIKPPYEENKQEKRHYLRSPEDTCSDHLKFTVVDTTSLASGGSLCAFRELKNLNPEDNTSYAKFAGEECKWEKKRMKKEPVRFMIVDTSGKTSGIRRRRRLPENGNLYKAFGDPSSSQNQYGTTKDVNKVSGSSVKEDILDAVRSKKRSVAKASINRHKRRRLLSTCVRKDIQRFGQSPVSVDFLNIKTEKSEETGDEIEIQRPKNEPNGLCSQKQQEESNRLCRDKKCSSEDVEQQLEKLVQLPSMSGSDKRHSPFTDHGTTQEVASIKQEEEKELNQQRNTDLPRRQSTRKRPLTTRALEALESGFYTAKSMKSSTCKPIKRQRSTRIIKNSANASNTTLDESHKGFIVKEEEDTSSKPLDREEESFLADKETTAHQAEDSNSEVTTESPKRPPILLKFPFKRG